MPTPMISKQWPRFVLPIVRKEWEQSMNALASPVFPLFGVESANSSVEYSQGMGTMGKIPEYNSDAAEGQPGALRYDSFNSLYEKTFTHREFALGIAIQRKLIDDNQSGRIRRQAASLGHSFGTTRAAHASSVFIDAFSTTATEDGVATVGGDAVALCSASHPTSEKDATTLSNTGTTAFSFDAVVATLLLGLDQNDDRGNPMPVVYDTIVVPTALQDEAWVLVNSVLKPGGANNDSNYVGSRGLSVIVDPYLTNTKDWFMVDSAQSRMHLLWFNRVMPEIALDSTSDFNLEAKYRGYMRYSFGWDDWRWIYGHNVA